MGPLGYSEFHRGFLSEVGRESLVDVRFNGGGHVSQLILEKLNRKPLAMGWRDTDFRNFIRSTPSADHWSP